MNYWELIIIFCATALSMYLISSTGYRAALEAIEKRGRKERGSYSRYITPQRLLQQKIGFALFFGAGLMTVLVSCGVLNPLIYLPCSLFFGILGFFLPGLYYWLKERKRKEEFEKKILDLTISLAGGMRSGLALPQALEAASKRIPEPIREELGIVLREYRLGLELTEALTRLNQRMPCEDLHLLVTTIKLTTKSGGSLVDVLEKMIETIRGRTEFQERLKNMTAQGRFEAIAMASAPIVAFVLLYFINPELMKPMLTTGTGWCSIGAIAILVTIGFLVINKIVSIEV